MKLNKNVIAFTGGGTGGHIYPGLAVADELKSYAKQNNIQLKIIWIGCSTGMDKNIVEKATDKDSNRIADLFYGIPSGKLRRYFSLKNFTDLFKIFAGFVKVFFILKKEKPCLVFSKGGFVSVPPCFAAKGLHIPVFTHECDFTLGLANKLNFKNADTMFVSYEETKKSIPSSRQNHVIVTGNPIRPVFYHADSKKGKEFLGLKNNTKPILLVLGGSSGAKQVNDLVFENLEYLCKKYIVVHQTGIKNLIQDEVEQLKQKYKDDYFPYSFIYEQMPDVVASADVILSRAGANSIWEAACLYKPLILIPLCGSGTRGDQVDNAKYFESKNAAKVLLGQDATSKNLCDAVDSVYDIKVRKQMQENIKKMVGPKKSTQIIAEILMQKILEK